jgi:hypothetical protein
MQDSGISFKEGERIHAFYRFQQSDCDLFIPVHNVAAGACAPRIGQSDGWQQAVVLSQKRGEDGKVDSVFVEYTWPLWFDRHGRKLHRETERDWFQEWVCISQVRKLNDPPPPPKVSFLVVRWGGEQRCHPTSDGGGGWGRTGSNVSDPYMAVVFEETVWPYLGPNYQVLTIFIERTTDLAAISPACIAPMMTGQFKVMMVFLWPVTYQDAPLNQPGYVHCDALLNLIARVETCGVVCRFPHHAHLYRLLTSKSWMAHLSLMPDLAVPATTKIGLGLIARDPVAAAQTALSALRSIQIAKKGLNSEQIAQLPPVIDQKGVVKLGYSWEAWGVKLFSGQQELAHQLTTLAEQPSAQHDAVMVTEFVEFDVELRLFLINPGEQVGWDGEKCCAKAVEPMKILYTRFETVDGAKMLTNFRKLQRDDCVRECYGGDEAALTDAETQCKALAGKLLFWLRTETAEMPPVLRFDFMTRATPGAPGTAEVTTGELTECGACFLGWDEGPENVWKAVLQSCLKPGGEDLPKEPQWRIWRKIGANRKPGDDDSDEDEDEDGDGDEEEEEHQDKKPRAPVPPMPSYASAAGGGAKKEEGGDGDDAKAKKEEMAEYLAKKEEAKAAFAATQKNLEAAKKSKQKKKDKR